MSEKMTLEQVRDRLRSECAHVEKDENKYPECAYTTPSWLLGDLADDLDAIIESALAPRVVTDEDVELACKAWLANPYFGPTDNMRVSMRAALEAFVENRK